MWTTLKMKSWREVTNRSKVQEMFRPNSTGVMKAARRNVVNSTFNVVMWTVFGSLIFGLFIAFLFFI